MQGSAVAARDASEEATRGAPPRLGGRLPLVGHMAAFARNPVELMARVRRECGDVGEFRLIAQDIVLLSGSAAQETFCRAPDDVLSQKVAYKLMTPVFGKGVVFDAPIERMQEQLGILLPALRDRNMRTYASVFVEEVEAMTEAWGDSGELDLLDFTAELTTYTSSRCLLGSEFRYELNAEFAHVYAALEKGVNAIAYVNPYLPLPVFRRRDRARRRLVEMITDIIERRRASGIEKEDALNVLMHARYSDGEALTADEITGILTATMFAGHHTSSGTAAWTLIELLKHPAYLARVVAEIDERTAGHEALEYQTLREVPALENAIKETLRLHPPLVFLLRGVLEDFTVSGYTIAAGKMVAISPAVAHMIETSFPRPERYDPDRYGPGREEDVDVFAWIPFGGGLHRCSGSAFAMMQLKAIMIALLRRFEFALARPNDAYVHDFTKMVVQPRHPCTVRYRRRPSRTGAA